MAGIGFELKKLFRRKGLFAWLRAYGYAGIICTGPMLLGIALQLGILLLCSWAGAERTQQDLLVCMVTYPLLSSLTVTSFFSMPVTRYLADMLYEEREDAILPSFWGSSVLMLLIGCILYGIFLLFSGATLLQGLLCLWLFAEMILNWNGMSYLTAIKDYRGILCSFLAAIALSFGLGYLLVCGMWCCSTAISRKAMTAHGPFCAGSIGFCLWRLPACAQTSACSPIWSCIGPGRSACR